MQTKLAEEQIFDRKKVPLIYLVKRQENTGVEKVIESRSGLFYVLVVVVIFLSLCLMLNIALKIQSLNLEKKIIEINQIISIEKERTDRINLRISELKSPSRVLEVAEKDLGMNFSDKIMILKLNEDLNKDNLRKESLYAANLDSKEFNVNKLSNVFNSEILISNSTIDKSLKSKNLASKTLNSEAINSEAINTEAINTENKIYNNFIGTISNIKDIVMVVSEGVLTFFIP